MTIELKESNFETEVIKNELPVLVDFWASWCGPCRMVAPVLDKLAEDYAGKAVIGKVNVDEEQALAERFRVMSIPSIFLFKNGEIVEKTVGAKSLEDLSKMIDKAL